MLAQDVLWFDEDEFSDYWTHGFCQTFISGKRAEEVQRLAREAGRGQIETADTCGPFIATVIDGETGSAMLERSGLVGSSKALAKTLSTGTRITIVLRPFMGSPKFGLVENGELICAFNIDDPYNRRGSAPDTLLSTMEATGLLSGEERHYDEEGDFEDDVENLHLPILQAIAVAATSAGVDFGRSHLLEARHFLSFAEFHSADDPALSKPIM